MNAPLVNINKGCIVLIQTSLPTAIIQKDCTLTELQTGATDPCQKNKKNPTALSSSMETSKAHIHIYRNETRESKDS